MRWPTVQGLGLITAVCSLKYSDNDGWMGGFSCRQMPNLTQAHTVRGEKGTMNEKKKDISDKKKETHICLTSPSLWRGVEVKKSSACVLRWKPARGEVIYQRRLYLSFTALSPSSHSRSKSFLNLTCSC